MRSGQLKKLMARPNRTRGKSVDGYSLSSATKSRNVQHNPVTNGVHSTLCCASMKTEILRPHSVLFGQSLHGQVDTFNSDATVGAGG